MGLAASRPSLGVLDALCVSCLVACGISGEARYFVQPVLLKERFCSHLEENLWIQIQISGPIPVTLKQTVLVGFRDLQL